MNIRKSTVDDIKIIMDIFNMAKSYMKENNINQWQDGYPNEAQIIDDIKNDISYVVTDNKDIVGTAVITFLGDPNYDEIYDGEWLTSYDFCAVHRIAITNKLKGNGIANEFIKIATSMCRDNNIHSLRIDTHRQNISMQRFLEKNGFVKCGIIYLDNKKDDTNERFAYEKLI